MHVFSAPVGYLTRPYIVYRSRDEEPRGHPGPEAGLGAGVVTDRAPWLGIDTLGPLTPVRDGRADAARGTAVHDLESEARSALAQARASKHGKGTRVPSRPSPPAGRTHRDDRGNPSWPSTSLRQRPRSRWWRGRPGSTAPSRLIEGTLPDWVVDAGGIVPIPAERHGVEALTDCVILLTVSLDPHPDVT